MSSYELAMVVRDRIRRKCVLLERERMGCKIADVSVRADEWHGFVASYTRDIARYGYLANKDGSFMCEGIRYRGVPLGKGPLVSIRLSTGDTEVLVP